jgi:hypothetical protein
VSDALNDARRAAELDPVSPRTRENYIFALAQAGRTQAALQEIDKADRIWPGSSAISGARFAINLRFGDPRIAWQMIQSGEADAGESEARSFITARLTRDPKDIEVAINDARGAYQRSNGAWGHLVQTLSIFDREDELLDLLMHVPITEAIWITDVTFRPAARELWRNPKSLEYAMRVGLLQFWMSTGKWPDFCFEPNLPYDCRREAAKLAHGEAERKAALRTEDARRASLLLPASNPSLPGRPARDARAEARRRRERSYVAIGLNDVIAG